MRIGRVIDEYVALPRRYKGWIAHASGLVEYVAAGFGRGHEKVEPVVWLIQQDNTSGIRVDVQRLGGAGPCPVRTPHKRTIRGSLSPRKTSSQLQKHGPYYRS